MLSPNRVIQFLLFLLIMFALARPSPAASTSEPFRWQRMDLVSIDGASLRALSLASGDFDRDGVPDLIAGYADGAGGGVLRFHRGNIDSLFPNSREAKQRKALGQFNTSPFFASDRQFAVSAAPEHLAAGDFDADGNLDVVSAARFGNSLIYMKGDGKGNLKGAKSIAVNGTITALAAGEVNIRDGMLDLAVGVSTASGARVLVFEGPKGALRHDPETFDVAVAPSAFAFGQLDGVSKYDLAVAAGLELLVIHGRDRKHFVEFPEGTKAPDAEITKVTLPFMIRSLAVGNFTGKGYGELAALGSDGAIYALSYMDGWQNARKVASASLSASKIVPARISGKKANDLLTLDFGKIGIVNGSLSGNLFSSPADVLSMRLAPGATSDLVILNRDGSLSFEISAPNITYVVNDLGDGSDEDLTDATCEVTDGVGDCTLRAAIEQANDITNSPGEDAIHFGIPIVTPPYNITVSSSLIVTEALTIDGTTQPDFMGSPVIVVDGISGTALTVFSFNTSDSVLRGVEVFDAFASNIELQGPANTNLLVEGNITYSSGHGIQVDSVMSTIGGTTAQARNLIYDNLFDGLKIEGDSNVASGNHIGGIAVTGNADNGVQLINGSGNTIGGTAAGAGNVISGNMDDGIYLTNTDSNLIQGNLIGTDAAGTAAIANGSDGVELDNAILDNMVGGTAAGAGNVISGNTGYGINSNNASDGNFIQGNFIGTDNTGATALSNGYSGIVLNDSYDATVTGNVISGNTEYGIITYFVLGGLLQGNFIGTDLAGTIDVPNGSGGVYLESTGGFRIGGTTTEKRNIISGNLGSGVHLTGGLSDIIEGNFIGTDASGSNALPNDGYGVYLGPDANNNTVGGTAGGSGNTIAFNTDGGVVLGVDPVGNVIRRNSIFSNEGLGIDLASDGVTANDSGDFDFGENNLQNWPELATVNSGAGSTTIEGVLDSTASSNFVIEFFTNAGCDDSGNGEGQTFIGSKLISTDGSGISLFSVILPVEVPPGQDVTATATDFSTKDTSEFSNCVAVPGNACPTITVNPASLPDGTVGVAYNQAHTASGGTAPYTFAVTSGTLPGGLILNANGTLSGTPDEPGTFNFTVTATDNLGCTGSRSYTITMGCPTITVSPTTLPGATVGSAYNQLITAAGGTMPVVFTVTTGAVPPGTTLASDGTLSGTPTTQGNFNFTVTATDALGCTGTRDYTVNVACPAIAVNPVILPDGTGGVAYNQQLTAIGGTAPHTFTITNGAQPNGTNLSPAGILSGTPTTPSIFNFTVTATDFYACMGNRAYTVTINCPTITLTPATLPDPEIGIAYSEDVSVLTGGTAPFTFNITAGALPSGLMISAAGTISGVPDTEGPYDFTVTVTDTNGCLGSLAYSVTVISPLLLFDDFGDAIQTWTGGTWVESGGVLTGTGAVFAPQPWTPSGSSICTLCTVEADASITAGGTFFLIGWFNNNSNKVELLMKEAVNKFLLKQTANGIVTKNSFNLNVNPGQMYNLRIANDSVNFTVFIDDSPSLTVPVQANPTGNVGFKGKKGTGTVETVQVSD